MNQDKLEVPSLDFPRIDVTDEFIKNNNLTLKRSQSEILAQYDESEKDLYGFNKRDVLVDYLVYDATNLDKLNTIIRPEYFVKLKNGESHAITDVKECAQYFLDYMVFAWGKAIDQRRMPVISSIKKLSVFLWLLGRDDLGDVLDSIIHFDDLDRIIYSEALYHPYGMPALIKVCKHLSIPVPAKCHDFVNNFKE